MAKDKKKTPVYKLGDGSIVSIITESLDKHGKIKIKNKKRRRVIQGACVHHIVSKNGKVKPRIKTTSNKTTCRICGESFRAGTYGHEEVTKMIKGSKEVVNNMKFLSVAIGAGSEAVRFSSELGSMLTLLPGNYAKIAKVARKADSISKKKKKKKNNSESAALGSWR